MRWLTDIPCPSGTTAEDAMADWLESQGLVTFAGGAYAHVSGRRVNGKLTGTVWKWGHKDSNEAFLDFFHKCITTDNPFLPKYYSYVECDDGEDVMFAVEMERLKPLSLSSPLHWFGIVVDNVFPCRAPVQVADLRAELREYAKTGGTTTVRRCEAWLKKKKKEKEFVQMINIIQDSACETGGSIDMGMYNYMLRANGQIVMTDPLS